MSIQVLIIAFVVSFVGSIPPGTINITSMQLSVLDHKRAALFFALAASLTELIYAGATVRFQMLLNSYPFFTENFQIITAAAMIVLGILNLFVKSKSSSFLSKADNLKGRNGFKRGVILSILNPLTIPFWLTVTAYLQSNHWISLDGIYFWWYVLGISTGTFSLLLLVNKIGNRFTHIADNDWLVHKLPGIIFIILGLYNFIGWIS